MKFFAAILILIIVSCIPPAIAGEVILSTPQSEYYFTAGDEAVIPLSLVSTYDRDVTGTLALVMVPAAAGSNPSASRQTRQFSAFTEKRTVSIPVGRSDIPADYLLTVTFSYNEGSGRTSVLGGIGVHFLTSMENAPENRIALTGADITDPAAGTSSQGSSPTEKQEGTGHEEALQISQMAQDTSALRDQMAEESNQSADTEDELLQYIRADPLVMSLDRTLSGAGYFLNKTGITPVSNRSGSFVLTYSSGPDDAVISGVLHETRVLFAEESSRAPVPLPGLLLNNTTYQEYGSRYTENGFTRSQTRINVTPGTETVNLTYAGSAGRILHMNAQIEKGTVVAMEGDSPEDPLAPFMPVIVLVTVILISAGIWYLATTHTGDPPVPGSRVQEPELQESPRQVAGHLLDEAERDAAAGLYRDAYRKTGRAIRIVLSFEIWCGDELTNREVEHLLSSCPGDTGEIRQVLDRCQAVGFAKGIPEPGECTEMIRFVRERFTTETGKETDCNTI